MEYVNVQVTKGIDSWVVRCHKCGTLKDIKWWARNFIQGRLAGIPESAFCEKLLPGHSKYTLKTQITKTNTPDADQICEETKR